MEAPGGSSTDGEAKIAVALSGGGHRSCLWALGVLLYLTDAGKQHEVGSIASVSGGSIANGTIAQCVDYRAASPAELESLIGRVAKRITRGTVLAPWTTKLYIGLMLLATLAVLVVPWLLPVANPLKPLILLAGVVPLAWLFAARARVAEAAFSRTLFAVPGRPKLLREVDTNPLIDHIFCATDLHAGENVYFSSRFVCSWRFGLGEPAELPLARVVQASAGFPGAFPVRWLPTAPHKFIDPKQSEAALTRRMALVDGGVYNNMGDQWAQGQFKNAKPGPSGVAPPQELVVASGSAGLQWSNLFGLRWPVVGGVLSLMRDKSVLYDDGNSVRRSTLVSRFDLAAHDTVGLRGALVHIEQSPFRVPDAFVEPDKAELWPDRARRAQAVLARLGEPDELDALRTHWQALAKANAKIHTTLKALSKQQTVDLLYHSYLLAMVDLHVILGYPLLAIPERGRFEGLLGGAHA
ncbi:MAG TPA: patatin-like phospholipase family protein [Solirubrobacteraceae bacterium]|jgi:predicted acylesterase/phospholipase RssA